jgi:hypothetical protein
VLDKAVGLVRRPTKGEKFNDKPALQTPCQWILVTNEDQKKEQYNTEENALKERLKAYE